MRNLTEQTHLTPSHSITQFLFLLRCVYSRETATSLYLQYTRQYYILFVRAPHCVTVFFLCLQVFNHYFCYFLARLMGGVALDGLLKTSWPQASPLLPPRICFRSCCIHLGFGLPSARRFSSTFANSRSLALPESHVVGQTVRSAD